MEKLCKYLNYGISHLSETAYFGQLIRMLPPKVKTMLQSTSKKLALVLLLFTTSFTVFSQENALNFDGSDDLVNLSNSASFNIGSTFTFETWVNLDAYSTGENAILFNKWQSGLEDKLVAINPTGNVVFSLFNVFTLNSSYAVQLGEWVHIAATYDGANARIYINGVEDVSTPAAGDIADGTGTMWLGGNGDGRSILEFDYLDGSMDDTRFWSVARTELEILQNLDNSLTSGTGLIASYDYDSGVPGGNNTAISLLTDITPGVLNGTFSGFALNGGFSNFLASTALDGINYTLLFDGSDEYLTTDNLAAKQINQGTVEAWVRASSATAVDWSGIAVKQLAYGLFVRSDAVDQFGVYDWSTTAFHSSGVNIMDDAWHHVAFTFNNGVANASQLYLDGVAVGPAFTYNINAQTSDFVMAAGGPAGTQHLNGSLDEVRIWNTVRSASQINAFKDVEINSLAPGLVAYYNFSDGPNSGTVSDLKGGNPGLLTNMEVAEDWIAATHGVGPAGPLDSTNPDVSISSTETDPTAANPIPITITFTEEVAGFDLSDIFVGNGTPSNLNTADNITFTADVAPTGEGVVNVDVFGSAVTDLTGNFNNASPQFGITYDLSPPVTIATVLSSARNRIFVEFDEPVFGAADGSTPVDAGDFTVNTVGGTASVIVNSLNVLSPRDIEFDITISGVPDGSEVVDVTPIASSVYDAVGNIMSVSQTSNLTRLIDESVLSFDGSDDFVRVATDPAFGIQQYTLEAWINIPELPVGSDSYTIVSKGTLISDGGLDRNGYTLLYGDMGGGTAIVLGQHTAADATEVAQHVVSLATNTWYHIAASYDGTTMRVFLDGVEVGFNSSLSNNFVDHTGDNQDVKIGAMEGNASTLNFHRGLIDEVRIWNYARSAAQITALMDEEISGTQNGLVAYYDFNQGTGTTLTDIAAGRNGTLDPAMNLAGATGNWASGGTALAPADVTAPNITFAQNLQTIGTTIIGGTHDDNLATIEVSLDGGTTRTPATNNGDGTWGYDMSTDPNFGGEVPYSLNFYIIDEAENEGTLAGNVAIDFQNALDFDGIDDGVNTGITTAYGASNFTWEAWFYSRNTDAVRKIIAKDVSGNDPELTLDIVSSGTSVRFKLGAADLQAPINMNEWYHVAAVRDGLNHYLYLNGELVASQTLGAAVNHTFTNPITIGMRSAAGSHFNGLIDEVRLWSVARTQTEIVDNAYNTLSSGTGLVRSFGFDQQSGNPIDLTGTADGTFNGAPFYTVSTALDVDAFPPNFVSGFPLIDNITDSGFDITVQLNEEGQYFYVVVPDGATTPSVDDVRAGTGFGGTGQLDAGNILVTAPATNFVLNATGLSSSTNYDLYIVAQDDEGSPNVQAIANLYNVTTLAGPAPGGVNTNLSLWLKADQGVTGTTQVSQWDDQAGGLRHGTQATATNQPALTDNAINYNPAISFDGTDDFFTSSLDISPTGAPDLTTIIVFNSDQDANTPLRKLFGHDAGNFHRTIGLDSRSGNNFNFFAGSNGVAGFFDLAVNTNYVSTIQYTSSNTFSGYIDGNQRVNGASAPVTGGLTNLAIGAISPTPSEAWDGQIAEMIMYSGILTDPERQRIETYLAIKYGVSIDQTSATNYFASDGNPVWDGTANATYNQHIAGIGRDDASELDQKQSRSSDGRMSIGLGTIAASNQANGNSFTNDLAYFIWGDNGLDMAYLARNVANVPAGVDGRVSRIWRASEVNSDIGNVSIQIDLNGEGYPGALTAGNFVLLVDSDADFSTGAVTFSASNYAGGVVEFSGINLSNTEFFTLGINEPPAAPTNLIAYSTSGGTSITLEWTDNATNETGYNVERDTDPGFGAPTTVLNGGPANTTTFVDGPLSPDQRFYYRVRPTNGSEDASSYSSTEFGTNLAFAGDALTFDGTNDQIAIPDDPSFDGLSTALTIEAWINTSSSAQQEIVSQFQNSGDFDGYSFGLGYGTPDGRLSFSTTTGGTNENLKNVSSPVLSDGMWHHVAVSYDGTTATFYIDGVPYTDSGSSIAAANTNSTMYIGRSNLGTRPFSGQIDEVRIWDGVKSSFTDRFSSLNGDELGLVAYYPFDEGTGSATVYDASDNTNDGMLENGPLFGGSTVPLPAPGEVYNTSDSGAGSLREAITYANANPGTTITFNIPGGGPYNIGLATALPDITAAGTIINGTTQPGWVFADPNNMINIDGSLIGSNGSGIVINEAANAEIYGLIITGFTGLTTHAAIELVGDGADNAIIGAANMGNIIHGGGTTAIYITNADFTTIQGNWIGTLDGSTASGNNHHGISATGTIDNLTIGGNSGSGEGNIISGAGNGRYGILTTITGTNLVIQGNYIGTNSLGNASILNEGGGVNIGGTVSITLGGTNAGEENIISGNNSDANASGVIIGTGPSGTITNNIIGLAVDGTTALGNGGAGILSNTNNGIIIDGNVIASNGGDAITSNTGFSNSDIINNIIGLDATMTNPRPNGAGIEFGTGTGNRIGYRDNPNVIAENTGAAIEISNTATENTFATNQIYNNGSGIVLAAGANGDIAAPIIDMVSASDVSGTGVEGTTIHLYQGDGAGQGQTFLDSTTVSGGTWSISGLSLLVSDEVVATTTDYGVGLGTSVFSAPGSIPVQNSLAFDGTDDHGSIGTNVFGGPYTGPFTIEAWVNSSLTGNNNAALGSGIFKNMENGSGAIGDLALTINHLGQIGLLNWREAATDADGYTLSDASIPADTWTHVAASWDGSVNRIFINGVEQTFTTASTSTGWGAGFEIGRVHTAAQWHYDGIMDELRVWNVARSSVDITNNLFNELDPGSEVNLVAYYQFNQTSGVTIPDAKGSFDATWNGPIGTNTAPAWATSTALMNPASVVSTTSDTGAGSLRDAITYANANPGTTITFNIGESAPWVISLASALPQITAAGTIIDANTQPGWSFGDPNAMVQINGSGIGGNANGINIDAADVEVYGLIFTDFLGNISNGNVYLASDAADNAVIGDATRGNIFHGSGGNAIYIVNGDNATIQGNRIGTLNGTTASAMGQHGISTTGEVTTLTIGGDFFTGEGNLISGAPANRYGMNLFGSGGSGLSNVTIRGNKIGTNDAANGAIPNTLGGINILGTNSAITIGGPSPSDLNIISGNGDHGIIIQAGNGFDIDGNYIGLQSDGSSALGNGGSGIRINGTASNINIGTNSQNFISENVEYGIVYDGNSSSNTALGTNIFSCNQLGGIGYGSGPLTPGATIDDISLTTATVSTAAADGSTVFIYIAEDGCNNDQGIAFAGSALVSGGQATITSGFAPYARYVALVEDVNGFSQFSPSVQANFVLVTNTNDTGDGSFRAAIDSANTYPGTTIYFNLPGTGPWEITLASALPSITGAGTVIDATTQPFWDISTANVPNIIGNAGINIGLNFTSVNNVEVYGIRLSNFNIDGIRYNVVGSASNGYTFGANGKGNIFTENQNGIQILTYTGGGTIQGNYFGILPDGTNSGIGNGTGILLGTNADNVQIGGLGAGEGNVISNNTNEGIRIASADLATIQGNNIGLNPAETTAFGSNNGIDLTSATNVTVEQNVISGHTTGIRVNNSSANTFIGNNIGVASDGTTPFGNTDGIRIIDNLDSDNNVIGDVALTSNGNIIANNTNIGIHIDGAGNNGNLIYRNQIFNNTLAGISFTTGAQNGVSPPAIDPIASANTVTGTGTNGEEIDLYLSDGTDQGAAWLGRTSVAGGVWSIGSLSLNGGDKVVATTTNFLDGTSEFSTSATYAFVYPGAEGAGHALSFDGNNDFADLAVKIAEGRSAITLEAWINPTTITPGGVADTDIRSILSEGSLEVGNTAVYLGFAGDNSQTQLYAVLDAGSGLQLATYPASNIPLNEWSHVAMTWNSGEPIRLYVNGVEVAQSANVSGSIISTTNDFAIGRSYNTGEDYFDGEIDEVRIWDFAMPESSLREYLTRKVTNAHPSFANLLAYYRMDDNGDALNLLDFNGVTNATINGANYSQSGAHLGDLSIYEYVYTAGSGRNLGDFSTQNLGTANLPLHIYQVSQTPTNNAASGFNIIDDAQYYGVFSPGQTYQARYTNAGGVTSDQRILSRADLTDPAWVAASGFLGTEVQDNQIISSVKTGSAQYVTATQFTPYPAEIDGGSALSFDGVNDFVDLGGSPAFAGHQNLTLEAWINPDYTNVSDHGAILSNLAPSVGGGGYQLSISNANVRVLYRDNTFTDRELISGPLPEGEWSHLVGIVENAGANSNLYLYVNGIQVASALGVTGVPDYTGITNMFIGSNSDGVAGAMPLDREFGGQLDEVRIWNAVLTETEIRDHMIGRIDPDVTAFASLVAAYKFDDSDPNTAYDVSGSSDGAITEAVKIISAAPQGQGSIYSYAAGPATLSTSAFGEDIILNVDNATNGVHGYLIAGPPDQTAADGFNTLDQTKYYGVFAPGNPKVDIRMDYNNGGSPDVQRRIVYRTDATDNAASGGWERVSGLINSDPTTDSVYAYNVIPGEFTTATLNPPSSYPVLGDTDPGSAMDFDGTDDYIEISHNESLNLDFDDAFSIEAWVNMPSSGTYTLFSKVASGPTRGYRITINSQVPSLQLFSDGGASNEIVVTTVETIPLADWSHLAVTYDGSNTAAGVRFYLDGVLLTNSVSNDNLSGTIQNTENLFVGIRNDLTSPYQGQVDELRVWSAEIAAADILTYANTTDISAHPNYADMLAYYKFDEGTGSILEDVFANNIGTWNGPSSPNLTPNWVPSGALADAPEQNALNFDGDDYIDFVRQSFPSGLTFEAWINTTSTANTTAYDGNPALTVIGDNNNAIEGAFGIHDGKVRYTHWQGTATDFDQLDGTVNVNDGQWHHIAVTHKSGSNEVSIYVDGILDTVRASTIYNASMSANRVGASYLNGTGNDNFFVGDIDEVRIWNVALPEEEIRNFLYEDDLSASTNIGNLVLHYNFNQGAAGGSNTGETAATDQSSSALDGVLNGFALNGPTSNFISSGNTSFTPSAPVLQASNVTPSNIMEFTADVSWTNGDGDRRVVLVHEGTGNPFPAPVDGTFGEPNQYGLGTDLDGGWFVVYNGYGNSTTIENLSGATDYEVFVLEINGPPTFDAYNTNTAVNNPISFTTATPISNFALDFDGLNDQVQVSSPTGFPVGAAPRTMELWFKSNVDLSVDTDHGIAQYGTTLAGQMFGLITSSNAPGKLYFFGNSADLAGVTDLVQDQWYHAAVTFDGTTLSLYLDGNLEASTTTSLNTVMSGEGFTIGRRAGLENFWNGQLDEVRIWDYARTQTEIQNHMNNTLIGTETGLVAYYPMSDGVGNTSVADATGGPNGALLVGMDENTDWVAGPSLGPPIVPSTFFEDFDGEPLPGIPSSGPFAFGSGVWNGQGVVDSGDVDARGGTGNAARIEASGGNYIQTPVLDQATSFGFWYKGQSSGGVYEVLASTDGGITWDTSLGTINPDPTYQEFTVDFTSFFDPSYTGAVRIEYISGSNVLFVDDVSSNVDIVRPDVTITTLPLSDANINQGDTDVMIYKVQADISGGVAALEGFYLAIAGADSLDFLLNGFDFYQNVGSDNFGTATLMGTGSWSPGDPIPRNSIGQLYTDFYPNGTSVFYYVTADISPTANATTFNIGIPDIEHFGFGNSNKIDGGLAAGNNFTIMAGGDVTAPSVVSLTPSVNPITDSDTQLELVVQFDENMDTGINPTIDFPVEDPNTTLTFSTGVWDDPLNFRATYNVTDANVDLQNIDVQVTLAQDVAGNAMNIYNGVDAFGIDTENPIVSIDTYGTSITSPQLTGNVNDANAAININVDGSDYPATNNADGTWTLAAGLITSLADGTYEVVATATDPSGNVGIDNSTNELVISQSVITLPAENVTSTSFTARWSEGLDVQTYQIDVSDVADFSTFVSGFQGFQTTATSVVVNNLDFSTQYYYRVRMVNTSMQVSPNSNTTQVTTIIDPETEADSLALVQIYNAIAPQGLNWDTERLRNWDGVTLDANRTRVSIVDISNTSSAGNMPNPFTGNAQTNGGLSSMTEMNASNNQITGLMEFAGTAITNLNVSGNRLEFDDLEPVVVLGITTVDYSNQASVQYNESLGSQIEVRYTNDYTLSISIGGSSTNTYTWYRNDVAISTGTDFTLNGASATIVAIDFDNMGTFRTEITSSLVPGLTIDVDPQAVLAVADMQVSVTDANGDPLSAPLNGSMLETTRTATGFSVLETVENVSASTFTFPDVVLGDYIIFIESDLDLYIPTYFGNVFEWTEADTLFFRSDDVIDMRMTEVPPELTAADGEGTLGVTIEEDFGDDAARIDARRRAAKRKCGLRRKRSGGRIEQDDEFVLIAYGETDDNGEFQFGFLPQGTYRFFVEYPGIPIDDSSFVEFVVGEAGVSDTDFKLQAFATSSGIEINIEAVLGVILEYFKDLEIYPNPSSEYLNIRYRHLKSGDVTAELVDLSGNSMWTADLRDGFDGQLRIDVEGYEEGIYILRFYDRERPQENVVSFRVIVKH